MLIDTHCHINFNTFDGDRDEVIARAEQYSVTRLIIPATNLHTSLEAVSLASKYHGVYAAVGIHPNSTAEYHSGLLAEVEQLTAQPKVVAVGEIGIDYYWDTSPKAKQRAAFEEQLALASRLKLPVIIHNRDAGDDIMDILEKWAADLPDELKLRPGVLHSFSGSITIAERALEAGFYLGFTGPVTYKNADSLRQIAALTPLERILVETDSPFLTPVPHRGQRNEPAFVRFVAERIANLKQVAYEEFAAQTTKNAKILFALHR